VFNLDMKRIIKIVRCLWLVFSIFIGTVVSAQVVTQNGSTAGYRATELSSDSPLNLGDMSIADLQATFEKGTLTAETVVRRYLARIEAYDKAGPMINSTISLNPRALAEARVLDVERKAGRVRGPLHGIPFSLKDNINTKDLPTTAGSCLFAGSLPTADAFVVKKLRAAGAILLSKDNLSEFASGGGSVAGASDPDILRAGKIPQGFSSVGGQTRNPHDLGHAPAGSSGGTAAGIASAFAQFGLGTDTKSSVRGPSAINGIVGLRPTLGLLSRSGIVPLSLSFDTVGPIARSVYDVAVVLGVMAGVDPADEVTRESAGKFETDYTQFLQLGSLQGARIGIGRDFLGEDPEILRIFDEAVTTLKGLGAVIVDPVWFPQYVRVMATEPIFPLIRNAEFKAQIADYFQTLAPGYPKTLDELAAMANAPDSCYLNSSPEKAFAIKYTAAHALDLDDPVYLAALNHGVTLVKSAVQAVFENHKLDAIIYPTSARQATSIEPEDVSAGLAALPAGQSALLSTLSDGSKQIQPGRTGSSETGMASASLITPFAGIPELVIPAGMTTDGLPITISFMGQAYREAKLLGYGYDFEQATHARVLPRNTPPLDIETIVK
jgi:amidase